MTLSNVDITSFNQIEIDFYFYVSSMENGEDFWLRYFDGLNWTTVDSWISGDNINNNTFYNATVFLNSSQYNFATNAGFRFQIDASNRTDYIYIDQVTITGTSGSQAKNPTNMLVEIESQISDLNKNILLYPNPVKDDILNIEMLDVKQFSYKITNITGRTIMNGNSQGVINVSNLKSGMYFIEIKIEDETIIKRFIRE